MGRRDDNASDESFGTFQVHEELGCGGMARVHRATKICADGSRQPVALKRILPHLASDERLVASFEHEASLAMRLRHRNIVPVYEFGHVDSEYFISMEFIEGWNLRQILRQARAKGLAPSTKMSLRIAAQIGRALAYAHQCSDDQGNPLGLVHRDVTPANVLISQSGELKIIDFGIAHTIAKGPFSQSGTFKGKLAYMAPEAIEAGEVDARSDIWSLGVLSYELLTGASPFDSENEFLTIERIRELEIPSPASANPDCPLAFAAIILRALERDPERRWQSSSEMAEALDEVAASLNVGDDPDAVARWCNQVMGGASQAMLEDPITLTNIRVPSVESELEAATVDLPARPGARLPLPLPPAHAAHAAHAAHSFAMAGHVAANPQESTPRISYRAPTAGEFAELVEAVAVPPAGLSYLHTKRSRTSVGPAAQMAPSSWPGGTVSPPAMPGPTPARAQVATPTPPPTQSAPWRNHAINVALGFALGSAVALGYALGKHKVRSQSSIGTDTQATGSTSSALIDFVITPESAQVLIDGQEQHGSVMLDPGRYNLEIRSDDYRNFSETLEVRAGEQKEYRIALSPSNHRPGTATGSPAKVVASNELVKVQGKSLALPADDLGDRSHVRVLLCVSPQGEVSSAKVVSDVSATSKASLEQQLASWRYQPAGATTSACFASYLRVRGRRVLASSPQPDELRIDRAVRRAPTLQV